MKSLPQMSFILSGLLLAFPVPGSATVGFAEWSKTFQYDREHTVERHHGDICGVAGKSGKQCLVLAGMERSGSGVYYEKALLDEISVPEDGAAHVLARRRLDDHWIIYGLVSGEYEADTLHYEEALIRWQGLGYSGKPVMANPQNISRHFRETRESRTRALWFVLSLAGMFAAQLPRFALRHPLAAGVLACCLAASVWRIRKRRAQGTIWVVLSLLLSALVLLFSLVTGW